MTIDNPPRLTFTAPWDPVVVRRGDALGLRALTDQFADAVAPDLSNRIQDGRWVTILAWSLARSHEAFHASGGRSVATRLEQRQRYAWLRPLELMWIARTIALADDWDLRALNGRRRVRPWYQEDRMKSDRFGMSEQQFRAYRQTGMYGGYRLAFRKWPGMTLAGDGWTPGPGTHELARWLDDRLRTAGLPWRLHETDGDDDLSNTAKRGKGKECTWWLRKWSNFDQGTNKSDPQTLPRPRKEFSKLPEALLLDPLVFGADQHGSIRRSVAKAITKSNAATHIEACEYLAAAFAHDPVIEALPRFSRLADAGMEAMDLIARVLGSNPFVQLVDIAKHPDAKAVSKTLFDAARAWEKGVNPQLRHIDSAVRFAGAITSAKPAECFRALLNHHESYGGGLRWFVQKDDRVEPRSPASLGAARYRFRLWTLCRLAVQCGVVRTTPLAIRGDLSTNDDGFEDGDD